MELKDTYKHKGLRKRLVEQLMQKGITNDAVLQALLHVPRHYFFSREFEDYAYEDQAFPIEEDQTISQPFTVAFQTEHLMVKKGMKVLEIGTGSGYQCAILAQLGAEVYSIERKKSLHENAGRILQALGYKTRLFYGDGTLGLTQHLPYDRIIVTAGAPAVPKSFADQLKPGGIILIPVGDNTNQKMLRITKQADGTLKTEQLGDFKFVPLLGEEGW